MMRKIWKKAERNPLTGKKIKKENREINKSLARQKDLSQSRL